MHSMPNPISANEPSVSCPAVTLCNLYMNELLNCVILKLPQNIILPSL